MIAAAVLSLYIAGKCLKYADIKENYQSRVLLEVFWMLSGVLFAIGATVECEISSRSRRAGGWKRS